MWTKTHSLEIDTELGAQQRQLVAEFGNVLLLCFIMLSLESKPVRHYFVTDGRLAIMFGSGTQVLAQVEVGPLGYAPGSYDVEREITCTTEIRQRMASVCGCRGHSFYLRNSEHLCRYIFSGSWLSKQVFTEGLITIAFKAHAKVEIPAAVNTLPVELKNALARRTVYQGGPGFIRFKATKSILSGQEAKGAYNVVLLGPTGVGKSHLVNMLYNQTVSRSATSVSSVTRNMRITQGTATVLGQTRDVNVIDTIGFCDSELSPSDVMNTVKQHLTSIYYDIDKVVLVCAAGRLEQQQQAAIRQIMEWLRYTDNKVNFVLVYNKCDGLDEAQREDLLGQACEKLHLDTSSSLPVKPTPCLPSTTLKGQTQNRITDLALQVAVGFPPNANYASVTEDHLAYLDAVFHTNGKRLKVDTSWFGCAVM